MLKRLKHILCFTLLFNFSFSQTDSTLKEKKISVLTNADSNMVFKGKRMIDRSDTGSNATLIISGYVSAYYASYDDEAVDNNGFVKFATMAPRSKEFGLNMALISMHYHGKNIRSGLGVHFGDIAKAVWPAEFNMIQEANAGFRLYKNFWVDAGFLDRTLALKALSRARTLHQA